MKKTAVFLLFIISFIGNSQTTIETINSKKLNALREIIVKLPNSYATNTEKNIQFLLF